jgi:hypothetical protein
MLMLWFVFSCVCLVGWSVGVGLASNSRHHHHHHAPLFQTPAGGRPDKDGAVVASVDRDLAAAVEQEDAAARAAVERECLAVDRARQPDDGLAHAPRQLKVFERLGARCRGRRRRTAAAAAANVADCIAALRCGCYLFRVGQSIS